MRKSIVWMPVLLVGSMVYWTLALGFGGLSLMSVTSESSAGPEAVARDSFQSITVNLADAVGAGAPQTGSLTVDLVSDREAVADETNVEGVLDEGTAAGSDGEAAEQGRGSGQRPRFDRGPGETAY